MSENATFTPLFDSQELAKIPMKSGDKVSGMYFRVGSYKLSLQSGDFKVDPVNVEIEKNKAITAVAFHTLDEKSETLKPVLVALSNPEEKKQKGIPLRIRSFSKQENFLDLGFDKVVIPSMDSLHVAEWKGTDFPLKIQDQVIGLMEVEAGETPHTLLIWDKTNSDRGAVLISHKEYSAPAGLREDLTFGPKREEFKNLRTLKPAKTQGN